MLLRTVMIENRDPGAWAADELAAGAEANAAIRHALQALREIFGFYGQDVRQVQTPDGRSVEIWAFMESTGTWHQAFTARWDVRPDEGKALLFGDWHLIGEPEFHGSWVKSA
jgi:hypothetical protein